MQPFCNRSAKSTRYQFNWGTTRSGHTGFPDSSVYKAVDQICEEIARKEANNADETNVKCVVSSSHDHNAGHIATDEPEIRLVNQIDFSMKGGVAFSSEDAFLDKMDLANCKQPLQLSELQCFNENRVWCENCAMFER